MDTAGNRDLSRRIPNISEKYRFLEVCPTVPLVLKPFMPLSNNEF